MKKFTLQFILLFSHLIGLSISLIAKQKVCIVIPAYNEEKRIPSMLEAYVSYFNQQSNLDATFLIVANNCNDQTVSVCQNIAKNHKNIEILDLKPGGKGFALKTGFLHALNKEYDMIGFVDADMATLPQYFHDLITSMNNCDGAIASRYAYGANVWPKRPVMRKIGGKIYNWILQSKLGVHYADTQCGAKMFTYDTIKRIAPEMTEQGWAFDLELLYLCKLENKNIKEVATTWSDQPGSHLQITRKLMKEFLSSPNRIKKQHCQKHKEYLFNKKQTHKKKHKKKNK